MYGETNYPLRTPFYPGFHLVDTFISIELSNEQWLSFMWDEDHGLKIELGAFPHSHAHDDVRLVEAENSLSWFPFRHSQLKSLDIQQNYSSILDQQVISNVRLSFDKGDVWIIMAEEPNPDMLPQLTQLTFDELGWLYIVFEKEILNRFGRI